MSKYVYAIEVFGQSGVNPIKSYVAPMEEADARMSAEGLLTTTADAREVRLYQERHGWLGSYWRPIEVFVLPWE